MRQQIPDDVLLDAYTGLGDQETARGEEEQGGPSIRRRASSDLRRRHRPLYPPSKEHMWERVAADLYTFINETPDQLAEALMPEGRAPFTAAPPKAEQLDFWMTRLFLPDGSVNLPAVEEVLATASPDAIRGLAAAIHGARGGEAVDAVG